MGANMQNHFLMANIGTLGVNKDRPYSMSRYMGGHKRYTQPYVSGYWYFMILTPDVIFAKSDLSFNSVGSEQKQLFIIPPVPTPNTAMDFQTSSELWFHSSAESFTPPTTNLTKIDIPGMGGIGSSFIGGREITRTFTVAFREYTNLPIMSALRAWNSALDPYLGVSPLQANEWVPNAYKGVACAFLCKPTVTKDGETIDFDINNQDKTDIEQLYFFDGVWPETSPDDSFNTDIATNDSLQLSVTFSFDGWAYTKETFGRKFGEAATKLFSERFNLEGIIYHIKNYIVPGQVLG